MYAAKLETRTQRNSRYAHRRSLRLAVGLVGSNAGVLIHDLSLTGLLIETSEQLLPGELLLVEMPERGSIPATVVWSSGRFFGCQFQDSIPPASFSAALLRNPAAVAGLPRERDESARELDESARELDQYGCLTTAPPRRAHAAFEYLKYPLRTRVMVTSALAIASWGMVAAASVLVV